MDIEIKDKTILVVDDSLTIRMQVKELLEEEGYQTMLAKDGETCLEMLETEKPDAILLDIVMPGISGLDVCKEIKSDENTRDIPILILTHVSDTENKVAGLNAGANDYVTKPFSIEELNARISSILRAKELQRELMLARDEAEHSARAKASFLANMSHEIRTPMNGVIGFTDLLLETEVTDEQKEYLEAIKRSGQSLLVIINDILDFSKMDSANITLEETGFDLDQLLSDISSLVKSKLNGKDVLVSYNIEEDVPAFLTGDPYRLRQVLINILGNSAKFTKKGEIVSHVRVEKEDGERVFLHVEISDTGIGIPKDKIESIFELFTQADSSTTRKFGGTGLGLSIARNIARKMGGDCWAKSELGKGSTFHVSGWLGIADKSDAKNESIKADNASEKRMQGTNISILLAEDNPVNQMLAKKVMEKMGHTVKIAENGKRAVEMLKKAVESGEVKALDSHFDIIFMDMQMPEMDGVEATRQIRKWEEKLKDESSKVKGEAESSFSVGSKRMPIVAMTANVLDEHREQCFAAGMDDFVTKPIKKEIVLEMMSKWVFQNNKET